MLFVVEDMRDDRTASEVAQLRNELRKTKNDLLNNRDRVDISLKEYEELKRENQRLSDELRHAHMILEKLYVPMSMISNIIPSSVKWYENADIEFMTRRIQIVFDVER